MSIDDQDDGTDGLISCNWPPVFQDSDGKWSQVWTILLREPIEPNVNLEDIGSHIGKEISAKLSAEVYQRATDPGMKVLPLSFAVRLHRGLPEGNIVAFATVAEKEWHRSSLFMSACWSMLKRINDSVGEISEIQWQPRDSWLPWRKSNPAKMSDGAR